MNRIKAEDYLTTLANIMRDRQQFHRLTTHELAQMLVPTHEEYERVRRAIQQAVRVCNYQHKQWYIERPEWRFEPLVLQCEKEAS